MSCAGRYWIAIPATVVMHSAAMAHPDITTHAGTLTYLISAILGAALLLSAALLNRLLNRRIDR